MKIDLNEWVGRKVRVTFQRWKNQYNGILYYSKVENLYYFKGDRYDFVGYTQTGKNIYTERYEIIHIEELTMNTEQILKEINKTQDQLNKLQAEFKKAEEKEKFNKKFFTPIEHEKEYQSCLKLLKTKNISYIIECFAWDKTPQGVRYWEDISENVTHLAEYDIHQIKDWVINYLIRKS